MTAEFNRLFERLEAYDQANLAKLSAERAKVHQVEQAKSRFIADLSHQLKTPITSLSMSIGILADKTKGLLKPKYDRLFDIAVDDCARLSALINELVDVSRLETMLTPRSKEMLDVEDMVQKCLQPLRLQSEEKGVSLETRFQPDLPRIAIDSFRFPWVITNLVGNALRYTPPGGRVELTVQKSRQRFYFQCHDTGAGIDPVYLPRIFDRYAQFSEREATGTIGLGLAIVKEIIDQHGGDIKVDSRPGQGTTFTFWIPTEQEKSDEDSPDR